MEQLMVSFWQEPTVTGVGKPTYSNSAARTTIYARLSPSQIFVPSSIKWFRYCFVDNVHFQQAAEISEALVEEQVDFEAMVRCL